MLNTSGDFTNGQANLTTLGMTYTGNTGTGTFTATSGGKTGTSGNVTINPGALASFTFVATSPQTDGVAFTGTNTLTAKDASGNTITGFNASANNVTITPNSLAGAVSFTSGATGDVLNASGDFTNGQANLTTLGMTYTGTTGAGTFTATSGGKTGTSGSVTIAVGALDHFTVPTPAAQLVSSPSAPNVTASGCSFSCNTTWHYEVTAVNAFGETLPGTSTSVSNASSLGSGGSCNGGFFGTCTNTVTTPSSLPTGATSFNLYRSSGSGSYGLVATGLSTSAQVTDNGLTAGAAPPTSNTATYPITVGIAFSETITALDVGGNPASGWTSGTNCVKFSGPSSSPSPSNTAPSYGSQGSCASGQTSMAFNASGQATASITLFDAQSTTLMVTSVTAPANKTGTSGSFTVAFGGLDHFAFSAASPQTDGVAFTGVNTLTAQDLYDNTITGFNASTNNVTITANSPLTGTVSGIHGSNVLNQASDFTNGQANLTSLGMTYTGNANTGTFSATSATGAKTGTSGSVTIAVGALDHFAFVAASPQTNGVAFSGTNTLTAQDVGNNTITNFNASTNNVTITANSPLTGTVSGLQGAGNVLNTSGDFTNGQANLTTLGMTYTGNTGTGTFTATSGGKTGTSGNVTINPGALASFTFVATSPQTDGVAFTGTNTLTAKDASGNTITGFNASANNVTITPNSLAGAVSFTSGATGDVLNASGDFTNGQANLTTLGMTYTGTTGAGTFTATSGGKTGTSGSVTIAVGALDHFAFAAASPQTDGVAFTGVNTLTAQDVGNNTITNFNASTNNVTVTAVSPLTGAVTFTSGATGDVLNTAGDFSSGVANLTSLGMTYTGNANTGTFSATSGGKTGTSGSVTIAVGALDHFAFVAASPQTNGVAFSGTNTLTAQDIGNNTITGFNAATNNVTVTAVSPLTGAVTFTSGATGDVLNTAGDFSSGVANLTTLGMTYTGNATTGTFKATSATGAKTGTSGSVTINPGALASFTFVATSPQTDGVAFTGTNTLTAKDASGNTITGFNASANNVTITPNSLAGAVSFTSGATGDVLNASGDFTNGQANLTTLGMTYTGTTGAGTFTATSGGKTGTSGSVTIAVGALDHFAFAAASPQTDGVAFTGVNT